MKSLISILSFLVMAILAYGQEPASGNCQLATVIQVDGHAEEWPMTWMDDPDKKFNYNVCSDDNNLYVRMKAKDEFVRRKIGLFGFTLWMDANGKKKKKLGLRFPTGSEATERMEARRASSDQADFKNMTGAQRADFQKAMNAELIRDLELLELIGLADDPLTSTRSGITNGVKVAIAVDEEGAYVYEAILPFKAFRLSKSSISTLGVGFETGKFIPPTTKPPAGGGGQGANSGYGGYGGAGNMSRGQGYRGSGGGNPQMSSSTSMWVPLKMK